MGAFSIKSEYIPMCANLSLPCTRKVGSMCLVAVNALSLEKAAAKDAVSEGPCSTCCTPKP